MAATPSAAKSSFNGRTSSGPALASPANSLARHVKAVLLALGKEKRVLASHTHWDREEPLLYREKLQAILNSSGAYQQQPDWGTAPVLEPIKPATHLSMCSLGQSFERQKKLKL